MITINELQERWNSIAPFSGGYLLISDEHPLSFHIGYHSDSGKCFIVLDTGYIDSTISSKAISVECVQTNDKKYALRFSLNYPSLDELFVKFCWDLMDVSKNEEYPVRKIENQYQKWIRLFQKALTGLMSSSLQKGLIGELLYFRDSLHTMPATKVLNAWVGPEGSDQDYIFDEGWAEIKAVSVAATEVEISSLQQLDRSDIGLLVVYFLDKTTSTGTQTMSLPEVINIVMSELPSGIKDIFTCKLAKYGFFEKDADKYKDTRYRFAEKRSYKIDQIFQRLTHNNVPSSIVSAHYGLSLPVIEANRIKED